MRNTLTTLSLSLILLTGFFQDFRFDIQGRFTRPVKKEVLSEAKFIGDFMPGYPENWISSYTSVEILATRDGKTVKAMSPNNALTAAQKNILNEAESGTNIGINIQYKYRDLITDHAENKMIYVSMTVVPETEAEYAGGREQMTKYLNENIINKMNAHNKASATAPAQLREGIVIFTVNEEGNIVNTMISKTSGDAKTDKLLVEEISKMPKWTPAKNSKGVKVKQEFEFSVGNGGC